MSPHRHDLESIFEKSVGGAIKMIKRQVEAVERQTRDGFPLRVAVRRFYASIRHVLKVPEYPPFRWLCRKSISTEKG
jgi:hypothetical protein